MGFFQRVGDLFTAAPGKVGEAWEWANNPDSWINDNPVSKAIVAFDKNVTQPVADVASTPAVPVISAYDKTVQTAKRGIATYGQVISADDGQTGGVFNFLNFDRVKDAWGNTGSEVTDTEGNPVEGISPGQAFFGSVGLGAGFGMTPAEVADRRQYYHGTWRGRLSSGAVDFMASIYVDPLIVGGKAVGAQRLAKNTLAPEEVGKVFAAARGDVPAKVLTKSERGKRNALLETLDAMDGLSASEIAALPQIAKTGVADDLATLLSEAGRITVKKGKVGRMAETVEERSKFRAMILGAAAGDQASLAALKKYKSSLAGRITRMQEPPVTAQYAARFTWDDGGQGALEFFNKGDSPFVTDAADDLAAELDRLERITEAPTFTTVGATYKEQQAWRSKVWMQNDQTGAVISRGVKESWMYGERGAPPIKLVTGPLGARLPGTINVADAARGADDARNYVSQIPGIDPATRRELLDSYTKAGTRHGRERAVERMELKAYEIVGAKYGLTPEAVKKIVDAVGAQRTAYMNVLKSRVYSAAPDARFVHMHDPQTDAVVVVSRPLAKSQVEDMRAAIDPKLLDSALKKAENRKLLEMWARGDKLEYNASNAEQLKDVLNDVGVTFTKFWKDATLFRLAYPFRVQVDSQGRLMATMGVTQALLSTRVSLKGVGGYLAARGEKDLNKRMADAVRGQFNRKADTAYKTEKSGVLDISPPSEAEDLEAWVRTVGMSDGGTAGLLNDVTNKSLKQMRDTGQWDIVRPADANWFDSWDRAVNQQIRNSPTAVQAAKLQLEGGTRQDLTDWLRKTAAGRSEWRELRESWDTPEQWMDAVWAHVDHYLPSTELKDYLVNGRTLRLSEDQKALVGTVRGRQPELQAQTAELDAQFETLRTALQRARADRDALKARIIPHVRTKAQRELRKKRAEAVAEVKRIEGELRELKPRRTGARAAEATDRAVIRRVEDEAGQAKVRSMNDVEAYFEGEGLALRMEVHGEVGSPLSTSALAKQYDAMRRNWYRVANDMPETVMARAPLYRHFFVGYMKDAIARHEGNGGMVTQDVLDKFRRSADRRARKDIGRVLFDTSHTSNLSHHWRFVSPFFSAWEDTMKKWAGLIYDKPQILGYAANAWKAPNNAGWVYDSEGNPVNAQGQVFDPESGERLDTKDWYRGEGQYVILPQAIQKALPGKADWVFDKKRFNIIFQGEPWWLPGFGPMVAVPTNEVLKGIWSPELAENGVLRTVLPFGVDEKSALEQTIPSWWRSAFQALGWGNRDVQLRVYNEIARDDYIEAVTTGRVDENGRLILMSQKELEAATRNHFIMRAVVSSTSPVTFQSNSKFQFYIDKARRLQSEYYNSPDTWAEKYKDENGKVMEWDEVFRKDYPDYYALTISLSANETGIQATEKVMPNVRKYGDWIEGNKKYGWMAVGGENLLGKFNPSVYSFQQAKHFRKSRDKGDFVRDAQEQTGWESYNAFMEVINAKLLTLGNNEQGNPMTLQSKGAEALKNAKAAFVEALSKENPEWAVAYQNGGSKGALTEFMNAQEGFRRDNPSAADRSDFQALDRYVTIRNRAVELIAAGADRDQVTAAVQTLGEQMAQENLGFSQMWSRVLERDKLEGKL